MTAFEVYKTYLGISNHFKGTYDYFKYRGNVPATEASFLNRKDRYFFEKLSRHYGDSDVSGMIISNCVHNKGRYWLSSLERAVEVFNEWKGRVDGLLYFFSSQCDLIVGHLNISGKRFGELFEVADTIPLIIRMSMTHDVTPETLIVLENLSPFLASTNKKLKGDPLWDDEYRTLIKYKPFLYIEDTQKYISVVREKIRDVEKGV